MTDPREGLAALADDLGFDAPEGRIDDCARAVAALEELLEDFAADPAPGEPRGSPADDEYNALLAVYDEPRTGADAGLLEGVPFAIKDCIAVRDLRMTCGARDFSYVPSEDATVVSRILEEGGAVVGKSNMDAFALGPTGEFSEFGQVVNPVADGHVPGGSSSGSAAAVAGGLVDAALGTDTGGSVRFPAACCGLVGAKPTHGLVSRYGFADLSPFTDTIGPLTRDVETAARTLEATKGYDVNDPTSSRVSTGSFVDGLDEPGDLTVGAPREFFEATHSAISERVESVLDALGAEPGVDVEWIDLDPTTAEEAYVFLVSDFAWLIREDGVPRGPGTGYAEAWREAFTEYVDEHGFNDHVTLRTLPSAFLDERTDGRSRVASRRAAIEFRKRLDDRFEAVDLLVTPTQRYPVPEYGRLDPVEYMLTTGNNTVQFSLAGTPAVTVPVGEVNGLPVGAQVVAPQFEDRRALQGARSIERLAVP